MVASPDAGVCGSKPVRSAARHVRESQAIVPKGSNVSTGGRPAATCRGVRLGVSDSAFVANDRADWRTFQSRTWDRTLVRLVISADSAAAVITSRVTTVSAWERRWSVDE